MCHILFSSVMRRNSWALTRICKTLQKINLAWHLSTTCGPTTKKLLISTNAFFLIIGGHLYSKPYCSVSDTVGIWISFSCLKVGIFPNNYVPFPLQNVRKLQPLQFCSLQSIIEKCMFKKKPGLCYFLLVIFSCNSFWDLLFCFVFYFVTYYFWNDLWLCICYVFFSPLMAGLVTLACDYWLLLHLSLSKKGSVLSFYVESSLHSFQFEILSISTYPAITLVAGFFYHILQVLSSELNKEQMEFLSGWKNCLIK